MTAPQEPHVRTWRGGSGTEREAPGDTAVALPGGNWFMGFALLMIYCRSELATSVSSSGKYQYNDSAIDIL